MEVGVGKQAGQRPSRYHKLGFDKQAVEGLFTDWYISARQNEPPEQIILDIDAPDDPLHGRQEGRFFHGYYGHYCYLPLYIFAGDHLSWAELRPSGIDAANGSVEAVSTIVRRLRRAWPTANIILRGDSGFARERLMSWVKAMGWIMSLAWPKTIVSNGCPSSRCCPAAASADGEVRAGLRRLSLPDASVLEPLSAGG